jgi:hypothetical protein
MKFTPDILEAAYTLLNETEPFRAWNLPHAEDVAFKVTRAKTHFAQVYCQPPAYRLEVSSRKHGTIEQLLRTMAHEMCHIAQVAMGAKEGDHGAGFEKLARQVCRCHHWDMETF